MKNTIKTIKERYEEDLKAKKEREEEIRHKESQLAELRKRLDTEARQGDVEAYKMTKSEISDLEDIINVLEAMDVHKSFTPGDVAEAWDNFRSGYDKEYDRLDADCKKKLREFAEVYKKLLEHQNDGLKNQTMLGEMGGINPEVDYLGNRTYPSLPLRYIPEHAPVKIPGNTRVEIPEVLCLVGSGIWKIDRDTVLNGGMDALETVWSIVHNHRAVPEIIL